MASFAAARDETDSADPAAPSFAGIRVVYDPVKGRCLENLVPRQAGDVLFVEEALVFSSYVEIEEDAPEGVDIHVNGQLLLRAFGEDIMAEMHEIHEELSNLPRIDCLDTARNFLQLVALVHLREALTSEDEETWRRPLTLLSRLTPGVYMQELVHTIRTFRHAYPRVLPAGMSDTDAATCLGVLNTNQLELEDYGGSGLFVGTAITEHSWYVSVCVCCVMCAGSVPVCCVLCPASHVPILTHARTHTHTCFLQRLQLLLHHLRQYTVHGGHRDHRARGPAQHRLRKQLLQPNFSAQIDPL